MKINDLTPLNELISAHHEWLLVYDFGKSFSLKSTEIEFEFSGKKTLFSFISESGFESWRIVSCELEGAMIVLNLTKNFKTQHSTVRLIPRTKSEEFSGLIELARSEQANRIARLILSETSGPPRLVRVELNRENGRSAEIIIQLKGVNIAVLADVTESLSPENLLSSAVIWLAKLARRKKNPIDRIWIISEKQIAVKLHKLHACFCKTAKQQIKIWEIKSKKSKNRLIEHKPISIKGLWRFKPKKLSLGSDSGLSDLSREILKLAPGRIDYLFSKNGETLRYLGLPFVRVRKILNEEKAWFGIDGAWRVLNAESYDEFYGMFEQLEIYRQHDSPNLQHLYFQSSSEAWLESILRKNIKLLDQNLILSPIYNQFRTSRDKIDLLALRRDGRLVIIELKVTADREMIFQAVDYWQKIELQRRKRLLDNARLFGDKNIADKNTIVYLAAPTLSYHRDFNLLSKSISREIEIFRFDLAENWRENVKVLGRRRLF